MSEIVIDHTATPDRRLMIVDSFGQRVQMSVDQFCKLAAEGVSGRLLDPFTLRPQPAWNVIDRLVEHIRPALGAADDVEVVKAGLERVRTRGNGAQLQTRMMERTGQLIDVVAHAVRVTAGLEEDD